MSKYTCLADGSWTSPSESAGSIQCQSGQIEICDANTDNAGIKIGQGEVIGFSGTVYVRSTNKKQAVYTAVPFDATGRGGGGGGGGSYTLPTASATIKGGIKVGGRLTMTGDVLSADSQTGDWATGKSYKVGDTVLINGRFYKCKTAHTSSSPINMLDWEGIYTDIPNWTANADYEVGNVVIYNDSLYQCNTAHTSSTTFDSSKFTSIGGGSSGDAKLTEAVTANTAAGAIAVNTTIPKDTTFTAFVKKLLIAEIAPTTTFTATNSGLVKKGTSTTTSLKLVINTLGTGTPVSIEFMEGSTVIDTQTYVSGTNTYTYVPSGSITTTTTFKAVLKYTKSDGSSATISKDQKFTFVDPAYYGAVASAPTTSADVIAVGNETVTDKRGRTVTYALSNQKSCYCYPTSLGALTSIKDANNFEYIGSYDRTTVNVTTLDGTVVAYYVYTLRDPVTIASFKQIFA